MGADPFALELKAEPQRGAAWCWRREFAAQGAKETFQCQSRLSQSNPGRTRRCPSRTKRNWWTIQTVEQAKPGARSNVVYVGDIDLMHSEFLRVRAQPNMSDIDWKFDNVTFVLNVVDELARDDRFLEVRKKQTRHSTLKLVEAKPLSAGGRRTGDR